MLVRMWSNRNSDSLLMGMKNGANTLEDSLMISYKTKHILIKLFSSHSLGIYLEELKTSPHKNLHIDFSNQFKS
jgi:hypothetical protein